MDIDQSSVTEPINFIYSLPSYAKLKFDCKNEIKEYNNIKVIIENTHEFIVPDYIVKMSKLKMTGIDFIVYNNLVTVDIYVVILRWCFYYYLDTEYTLRVSIFEPYYTCDTISKLLEVAKYLLIPELINMLELLNSLKDKMIAENIPEFKHKAVVNYKTDLSFKCKYNITGNTLIKIITSDNFKFIVPDVIVKMANVSKEMLEENYISSSSNEIYKSKMYYSQNITRDAYVTILEWCFNYYLDEDIKKHNECSDKENIPKWDTMLLSKHIEDKTIFNITEGSAYIGIMPLMKICCKILACYLSEMTVDQIRTYLNEPDDLTEEEKTTIREEYNWCLKKEDTTDTS